MWDSERRWKKYQMMYQLAVVFLSLLPFIKIILLIPRKLIIKWIKILECKDVGFSDKMTGLANEGKAVDAAYPD